MVGSMFEKAVFQNEALQLGHTADVGMEELLACRVLSEVLRDNLEVLDAVQVILEPRQDFINQRFVAAVNENGDF